jgi:hypothetical protein
MPNKISHVTSSHSESAEGSESDDSSSKSEKATGKFNEGRPSENSSSSLPAAYYKTLTHICPAPVRIVIGVFSTLTAVGGCVMSVLGANGLYDQTAPDHSLHQGLLGGGLTLVGAGGIGILSTFLKREHM